MAGCRFVRESRCRPWCCAGGWGSTGHSFIDTCLPQVKEFGVLASKTLLKALQNDGTAPHSPAYLPPPPCYAGAAVSQGAELP